VRIESIRVLGERLPLTLVEVVGDDGTVGIGGADAPVSVLRPIIKGPPWHFDRLIAGRDSADIVELSAEMHRAALGQSGLAAHAQAALDMALWDLEGKRLRLPLYRLFGATNGRPVMPYASATAFDLSTGLAHALPFKTTQRLVDEANRRVQEGYRAIKFGWGNHFDDSDIERIAAIRSAIGPEVRLMIDFGGPDYFGEGVSVHSASRVAQKLAPYDVYFLEEPLPPHDVDGYIELKQSSPIRIATGEMLSRNWEFERFVDSQAADVIQPDAYRIGITATLSVARHAAAAEIQCVPHSPWCALAVASHVQILTAIAGDAMVEFPSPSLYVDTERHGELTRLATCELVEAPLFPIHGDLQATERPGLGVGHFRYDTIERMEELSAKGLER
jgi:L-alanine-DL-glutamate epimerase-like enolase superfamily enzyme